MANRVSFSGEQLVLTQVAAHHQDLARALKSFFRLPSPDFEARFTGYVEKEISDELDARLEEIELTSTLTALSALEGAFRIDYLQRCYLKKKDPVSRTFRSLHRTKGLRIALDEEILDTWKRHSSVPGQLIGDLRGAFKFRHWLAHGRYWKPKLGQKYDFQSVYSLVETALKNFPFEGAVA